MPAAPSCDILRSLRASGAVMRHSGKPACQRCRHATFWEACVPAAPSCDILRRLRGSGAVMRHSGAPACQRARHATFWGACVSAARRERQDGHAEAWEEGAARMGRRLRSDPARTGHKKYEDAPSRTHPHAEHYLIVKVNTRLF